MEKILDKKYLLEEVDLIDDREYILKKLEEAESEDEYTLEEVYDKLMKKLEDFKKNYGKV